MKQAVLYFSIAFLSAIAQASVEPQTYWEWMRLVSTSLVQGFIALKALDSIVKPKQAQHPVIKPAKPSDPISHNP